MTGRRTIARWFVRVAAALFVLMAITPALFVVFSPASHDPSRCILRDVDGRLQFLLHPSAAHWFGTDQQGCDLYARTVHAARVSIGIALVTVTLSIALGALLGGTAGYFGGRVDAIVTRLVELFAGLPPVVFAVLVLSTRTGGRSLPLVAGVLGLIGAPMIAKVIRTAVLEIREREFVDAARASGASNARILVRHIGPNVAPTIVVLASLGVGPAIAAETTLAFLGLSVDPPAAGWGVLVAEGRNHLADRPTLLLFPAAFLVLVALTFVLLGDQVSSRRRARGLP